jgi:hypothetical protein
VFALAGALAFWVLIPAIDQLRDYRAGRSD